MRRRVLAIALAVVAAIVLVALRWHSLVPGPTPELPSSQPKQTRRPSPNAAQLAYREGRSDDPGSEWRLTGIVVDENATPVAGASLDVDLLCWHGDEEQPPSRTDAEGRFSLELLPDCTMWLYASHAGASARLVAKGDLEPITLQLVRDNDVILHVVDEKTHVPVSEPRVAEGMCLHASCPELVGDRSGIVRVPHAHAIRVRAAGYAERGIDVDMWPRYDDPLPALDRTIELRAVPTITGRVIGPDGAPAAGAEVRAPSSYDQYFGGIGVVTATDRDGRFEIAVREGGRIEAVLVSKTEGWVSESVVVTGTAQVELRLVKRTSYPAQRPEPPEVDVIVTVIDETGRPVPYAEIRSFSNALRPGRTDAAGRYAFRTRGIGDLYARRGERMSPLASVGAGHREVTLRIEPAAITGKVVDGDGRAVPKAWVRVRIPWHESVPRDMLSDADGHFGIVLPPGRYLISAYDEVGDFDYDGPNAMVISTNTRDVTFEIP